MTAKHLEPVNETLAGNTDTAFLKLLSLALMLTDHIGVIFFPTVMELRIIGRAALPLYAWCLVVGCVKTSNPVKYAMRLLTLALFSQPLYMMALNHSWLQLSILYLLLLGVIAIEGIRIHQWGSQIWVPLLCYLALGFFKVDYGWKGLTFILLLYAARGSRWGLAATFLAYTMFWGSSTSAVTSMFGCQLPFLKWPGVGEPLSALFRLQGMAWLALPLVVFPTHTGFRMPRWLGYALYPLHLVVLVALRLLTGTPITVLFKGF